jgi:hypothetical protein
MTSPQPAFQYLITISLSLASSYKSPKLAAIVTSGSQRRNKAMRSNLILGVTAVALSLGIGGALAATPTTNFLASSAGHVTDLFPAQTLSSKLGLSQISNSYHGASQHHFTLAATHSNSHAHIANLRAMRSAMRFVPSQQMTSASQDGLANLRQKLSPQSQGLSGLKAAAGLPLSASPSAQQFAVAAAKARPNDSFKLLSSLSSH